MSWIEPVAITLIGILMMTCPKIFTNAQGAQFVTVSAKLRNIGGMAGLVGLGLCVIKVIQG